MHRPPLPPGMFLVLIITRGWVDPRAMVQSEGNMSLKSPVTPPGIHPGTVRLVAQPHNHYATPGPHLMLVLRLKISGTVCLLPSVRFHGIYRNNFASTVTLSIGFEELAVRVEFVSRGQWLNLASSAACSHAFIRYCLLSRRWWIVPRRGLYSCCPQRYEHPIVLSYFACTKWFIRINKWKREKI